MHRKKGEKSQIYAKKNLVSLQISKYDYGIL